MSPKLGELIVSARVVFRCSDLYQEYPELGSILHIVYIRL